MSAGLPWLLSGVLLLLAVEYHAIVKWEEGLLVGRLGDAYRTYLLQVPRWVPLLRAAPAGRPLLSGYSWRETLFSERGTLIAIAIGLLLLGLKSTLATTNWALGAGG
jgi:hypothetical protein